MVEDRAANAEPVGARAGCSQVLEGMEERYGHDQKKEDGAAEPQAKGEHVERLGELVHGGGLREMVFGSCEKAANVGAVANEDETRRHEAEHRRDGAREGV